MPRDGEKVRRSLQAAALELYGERGYDDVTAAEIAARAGVTQRTFFRHFPDKREVLFDGQDAFSATLVKALENAPSSLRPWAALLQACRSTKDLLVENRPFTEPRRQIIARHPPLQERELAKSRSITLQLASALRNRGVPERQAFLAAQLGMTAFGEAFAAWLDGGPGELEDHLAQAFEDVHALSSGTTTALVDPG